MLFMNLKPIRDTIYVKLEDPSEDKSSGRIILASNSKTEPYASVVAVGPGMPMSDGTVLEPVVKVGDRVLLLGADIGKPFRFEGDNYQAISESMIIGVVAPPQVQTQVQ
jgi:chaperonin GroES